MSNSAFADATLDLAWRLWTEVGIPGVARLPQPAVADPEPLILWSAQVILADPRLRDLVFQWCAQHGERISGSRLRGLLKGMPSETVAPFGRLVAALCSSSSLRWPGAVESGPAWPLPADSRLMPLPLERPALLRFRLRALCGVGIRADVLCELLATGAGWSSAADLSSLGYTKRSIARILADLESARIARSRPQGNSLRFQLVDPATIASVVKGGAASAPDWNTIFSMLGQLSAMASRHAGSPGVVQQVEAHKARGAIVDLAAQLRLSDPPSTRGNPSAFGELLDWGAAECQALNLGSSSALSRS